MARAMTLSYVVPVATLVALHLVQAQPSARLPRIGFLGVGSASATAPLSEAFRKGLHELGYIEGQNILVEYRHAEGREDRIPHLVSELVRQNVDLLVVGSLSGQLAAKQATSTIPIVMPQSNDPVGQRLINSLARPGGNVTGLTTISEELMGKRLELFKEAVPRISRVAVLSGGSRPGPFTEVEATARHLSMRV